MAGAGNDFLMVDPKAVAKMDLTKLASQACDRTNGVGADGLIVVEKSKVSDYRMRIINADGSEAEMCGNGARCFAAYVVKNLKPKKKRFSIETLAGEVLAEAKDETAVVRLSAPKDYRSNFPVNVNGREMHVSYIDTGVPHAIVFVHDLEKIDVASIGRTLRYHDDFKPRGTNVNFVEPIGDDLVAVRTYERGVEDETKACGTGSVAAAIVSYLNTHVGEENQKGAHMRVKTKGGEILLVTFDIVNKVVQNVWLKGSAKFIATGEYYY